MARVIARFTLVLTTLLACFREVTPIKLRTSRRNVLHHGTETYSFDQYKRDFGKTYVNDEAHARAAETFDRRVAIIRSHNQDSKKRYKKGVNHFTDMSYEDMKYGYRGFDRTVMEPSMGPKGTQEAVAKSDAVPSLPKNIDWRNKIDGWSKDFGRVKNQGGCGSCWAFAATAVMEAHVAKNTKQQFDLAEQELVNCMPNERSCGGDGGCEGATSELAFDYVKNNGMVAEPDLSYKASDGKCKLDRDGPRFKGSVATISNFTTTPSNKYWPLMRAIAEEGPMTISVDAAGWSSYHSGIFDPDLPSGSNIDIDHAVVLVGYGEENGEKYWLVRNSWGPNWGEDGHIRIKREGPDGEKKCWTDVTPCDGIACKGECNTPIEVCGNSGILYFTSYPSGARLE